MSPRQLEAQVEVASQKDVDRATRRALSELGMTLEQLQDEAERGEFSSERAWLTWFALSPLANGH